MASPLDRALPPLAAKLLGTFGTSLDVRVTTPRDYDPATGKTAGGTLDYPVKGTVEGYPAAQVGVGNVERGDLKITIAADALPVVPTVANQVVLDGAVWQIEKADTVRSGEAPALYVLQVRR